MTDPTSPLTWKIEFSLLTNPNIVKSWLKAMGWIYVIGMALMVPVFIATGELSSVPMILIIFAGVVFGFGMLGFLIMFLILGKRSHARFTLSEKTIFYENMDNKAKELSLAAVLSRGLIGSFTSAGAGLLSLSNEAVSLKWESIAKAIYDPKYSTICLRNSYRELLHLYCSPENYDIVKQRVADQIIKNQTSIGPILTDQASIDRVSAQTQVFSPIIRIIWPTIMVVLACMPLFALNDITKLDVLIVFLIMTFSLVMVWMIPLLGWVTLLMEGYIVFQVIGALLLLREHKQASSNLYRKYEVLGAGEWIIIVLAAVGLIYLAWISIKLINGKMNPVLRQAVNG
ncbi:MAG: hypothetical protein ABIJ59_19460 [Pseudomonadota bacterium]